LIIWHVHGVFPCQLGGGMRALERAGGSLSSRRRDY
jgi:hypothetical protein